MAAENKPDVENGNKNKKRKQRFLPHSKSVKKGFNPLRPGIVGFFLTCDGGRERQAAREAINVIERFYEELVDGEDSGNKQAEAPSKPLNKKTVFSYSDASSDEDDGDDKSDLKEEEDANHENHTNDPDDTITKKQRLEMTASKSENVISETKDKSIDKLIEDEIKELGDRSKRRFVSLDSGCNGVVFVQMHKRDEDPSPVKIVQHMMTSASSTRKHMSRFILRVLPAEVACYASEEEISKAIKPLIDQYFPADAQTPLKFAVLYEVRANSGIDRMTIINSVAKSVPSPHKVNLEIPDKTIIVQIVKTVCLVGVVEKYKELSKYNLRQLTSPKA